jgi:hypothetical protein
MFLSVVFVHYWVADFLLSALMLIKRLTSIWFTLELPTTVNLRDRETEEEATNIHRIKYSISVRPQTLVKYGINDISDSRRANQPSHLLSSQEVLGQGFYGSEARKAAATPTENPFCC